MHRTAFAAVALLATLVAQPACASLVQAGTRGAITADYTVDWGVFGAEFTVVGSGADFGPGVLSGASAYTVFSGSTYNADFLPANNVLALYDASFNPIGGTFKITFDNPVQSAGAQVQANSFGAFSGVITAFNSGGTSLGSFAIGGNNNGTGDGSAVFAGLISNALDIKSIEFSGFGAGAAINFLSVDSIFATGGNIPEPPALLAAITYLGLMAAVARRRRQP